MKNIVTIFTILLLLSFSSSVRIETIKPAVPIHSITKSFSIYDRDEMIRFIDSCTNEGYIVKQINGAGSDSWWFVTLEKY